MLSFYRSVVVPISGHHALVLIGRLSYAVSGSFKVVGADLAAGAASIQVQNLVQFGGTQEQFDAANANLKRVLDERNRTLATANQNYEDLWNKNGAFITDALKKQFAATDRPSSGIGFAGGSADSVARRQAAAAADEERVRRALGAGAGGASVDPRRALLETQLKELDKYVQQEKAILSARDAFLAFDYAHGLETESGYFAQRKALLASTFDLEESGLNRQLALIDAYIASLGKKRGAEKAAEEERKKAEDIRGKLTLLQIDRWKQDEMLTREDTAAQEAYRHVLSGINEQLLLLQHNTSAATAIRLADSTEDRRRALQTEIDKGTPDAAAAAALALRRLNDTARLTQAQADLNDVSYKYGLIISQIGINQSLVDLLFQAGNVTELQAYAQKADAARQMIPLLNSQAAAYEAIAKASGDKSFLLAAQQIRLEIAKLAVAADALGKKFSDIFSTSLSDAITSVVDRTKKPLQALLDFGKSAEQQITKIAANDVSQRLFDKGGALGGVGSWFAKAFGDKGAGSATADTALAALGTSATTASAPILLMATNAAAAAAALAAVAASGAGGIAGSAGSLFSDTQGGGIGSLFGGGSSFLSGLGFAEGTPFVPKDGFAFIHRGEAIIPAAQNKPGAKGSSVSGLTVNQYFTQSTSRATADQAALAAGDVYERAKRKYR